MILKAIKIKFATYLSIHFHSMTSSFYGLNILSTCVQACHYIINIDSTCSRKLSMISFSIFYDVVVLSFWFFKFYTSNYCTYYFFFRSKNKLNFFSIFGSLHSTSIFHYVFGFNGETLTQPPLMFTTAGRSRSIIGNYMYVGS